MAQRPIFIPYSDGYRFVKEVQVEFEWSPGFAPIQKKKNIESLHHAAKLQGYPRLLEVSTKSDEELGRRLSAFNLPVVLENGTKIPLECAFQGSKVFERGGPFTDIYSRSSLEAKRDERIRTSGNIVRFQFERFNFPAEPKTAFYDWLYAYALAEHREFLKCFESYDGFTDIEFNPLKSINCQARSCALFASLVRKNCLDYAISSPGNFIETITADSFAQPYSDDVRQGRLL